MTNLCSNCHKPLTKGVMSPTIDKKRRNQCMECAREWLRTKYYINSEYLEAEVIKEMIKPNRQSECWEKVREWFWEGDKTSPDELIEIIDNLLASYRQKLKGEVEGKLRKEDLLGKQSRKRTYAIAYNDALLDVIKLLGGI